MFNSSDIKELEKELWFLIIPMWILIIPLGILFVVGFSIFKIISLLLSKLIPSQASKEDGVET